MEAYSSGLAFSIVQTMKINQALQHMSLNEIHNFRAIDATVPNNQIQKAKDKAKQDELNRLAAEIQSIQIQFQGATAKTLELKGAIRSAYNLTFDLEVWEQIPVVQQVGFGTLENAIKANDFYLEIFGPFVNSLEAAWHSASRTGDKSFLEAKMGFINGYLPQAEQNVEMVEGKLAEKALAKELDEVKI